MLSVLEKHQTFVSRPSVDHRTILKNNLFVLVQCQLGKVMAQRNDEWQKRVTGSVGIAVIVLNSDKPDQFLGKRLCGALNHFRCVVQCLHENGGVPFKQWQNAFLLGEQCCAPL